jgi:hypothetical protein
VSKADKYTGKPSPAVRRQTAADGNPLPSAAIPDRKQKTYGFSVERSTWLSNKDGWGWRGERWYQWHESERSRDQAMQCFRKGWKPEAVAGLARYRDLRTEQR